MPSKDGDTGDSTTSYLRSTSRWREGFGAFEGIFGSVEGASLRSRSSTIVDIACHIAIARLPAAVHRLLTDPLIGVSRGQVRARGGLESGDPARRMGLDTVPRSIDRQILEERARQTVPRGDVAGGDADCRFVLEIVTQLEVGQ